MMIWIREYLSSESEELSKKCYIAINDESTLNNMMKINKAEVEGNDEEEASKILSTLIFRITLNYVLNL